MSFLSSIVKKGTCIAREWPSVTCKSGVLTLIWCGCQSELWNSITRRWWINRLIGMYMRPKPVVGEIWVEFCSFVLRKDRAITEKIGHRISRLPGQNVSTLCIRWRYCSRSYWHWIWHQSLIVGSRPLYSSKAVAGRISYSQLHRPVSSARLPEAVLQAIQKRWFNCAATYLQVFDLLVDMREISVDAVGLFNGVIPRCPHFLPFCIGKELLQSM